MLGTDFFGNSPSLGFPLALINKISMSTALFRTWMVYLNWWLSSMAINRCYKRLWISKCRFYLCFPPSEINDYALKCERNICLWTLIYNFEWILSINKMLVLTDIEFQPYHRKGRGYVLFHLPINNRRQHCCSGIQQLHPLYGVTDLILPCVIGR